MTKTSKFFLATIIFFSSMHSAYSQEVEPQITYHGTGTGTTSIPNLDTPEQAFEAEKKSIIEFWSTLPNPEFNVTIEFGPLHCNISQGKINGRCHQYDFDQTLKLYQNGTYWGISESVVHILDRVNCPTNYNFTQNANETAWCSPPLPEPDCACDGNRQAGVLNDLNWVGDAISPATGAKLQIESDYEGVGSNKLRFIRTYRSDLRSWVHNYLSLGINLNQFPSNYVTSSQACVKDFGVNLDIYCYRYSATMQSNDFLVRRGPGNIIRFGTAKTKNPSANINDRLTPIQNNGVTTGWEVYNSSNDSTEIYNTLGQITFSRDRSGNLTTYEYSDTNTSALIANIPGLLISVTDPFGHKLRFIYDNKSRMQNMIDPDGKKYTYAYDEETSFQLTPNRVKDILTSVTYPDGKVRRYWYNEQDKTNESDLPFALTGITDENGVRFSSTSYNSDGWAVSSEHADGTNNYTVDYDDYLSSTITDPLGKKSNINFTNFFNISRSSNLTQNSADSGSYKNSSVEYDRNANIIKSTDFNGTVNTFKYDLRRNLETSRTEGSGTLVARTITTVWSEKFRLPVKIAEPKRLTTFSYDTVGNLLKKTEQATSDTTGEQAMNAVPIGRASTWSYTYNGFGQVLTKTGPRNDAVNITNYAYDNSGNLITVVNALGHSTSYSNYDMSGRVGRIVSPNGLIVDIAYDLRGRMLSYSVSDSRVTQTSRFEYDFAGQLTKVILPTGMMLNYIYDSAHRLTSVVDSAGNTISYTLDNAGNRIVEKATGSDGVLSRQVSRVYNVLNNVSQITGAPQ